MMFLEQWSVYNFQSSSWTMNQLCESGSDSAEGGKKPSAELLLHQLSQVAVRLLLMMTSDPILPFNVVDVTHAIKQALPGTKESAKSDNYY